MYKKVKKKKFISDYIISFDTNKTYIIPMIPSSNEEYDQTEYLTDVHIIQEKKGTIIVRKEGYRDKYFADRLFEFLIYTGYVKIKEV